MMRSKRLIWILVGILAALLVLAAVLDAGVQTEQESLPLVDVRSLQVVYLSLAGEGAEVWRANPDGGAARPLTATGGHVVDYAVSPDGERLAVAVEAEQGGVDLWLVDREGQEQEMLLDCGGDWCTDPDWSPDGEQIAFTRQLAGRGGPRIWRLDMDSGEAAPLFSDDDIAGQMPSWSPDGRRLAFVEPSTGSIRVVGLNGQENILLPTSQGLMGSWSPDGRRMVFIDMAKDVLFAEVKLYVAEFETVVVQPLRVTGQTEMNYNVPVWHPDGEILAVSQRSLYGSYSKQIHLIAVDGESVEAVTQDQNYEHAAYRWDPEGERLVYQRFPLELPGASPEVLVWERSTGRFTLIAEDAAIPDWLP